MLIGNNMDGVSLSKREAEFILLLMHDCPSNEMAKQLGLSVRTVNFYLKSMGVKLNAYCSTSDSPG